MVRQGQDRQPPKEDTVRLFSTENYGERERVLYRVVRWNDGEARFEMRPQYKARGSDEWRNSRLRAADHEEMQWLVENAKKVLAVLDKEAIKDEKAKAKKKGGK